MKITAAGTVDVNAVVEAMFNEDGSTVVELLGPLKLPKEDLLTGVSFMSEGADIEQRLLGFQCLAQYVRFRGDVRFSAELTLALVVNFQKIGWFASPLPHQRLAVANVIDSCANALTDAGHIPEFLSRAPQWTDWLAFSRLWDQWGSVQRALVEACFHAGFYERGASILEALAQRFGDAHKAHLIRLYTNLDKVLRAVDRPQNTPASVGDVLKSTLTELQPVGERNQASKTVPLGDLGSIGPALQQALSSVQGTDVRGGLSATDIESFQDRLGELIGIARPTTSLTGLERAVHALPKAGNPILETGNVISALGGQLHGTSVPYLKLAALAEKAGQAAAQYGFWDHACTLGWYRSVALRRAGAMDAAAAVLAELRRTIRERQLGVRQPILRAALGEYLPHLAGVSAEVLFALRREEELFEAIESAKGQILEALICERYGFDLGGSVLERTRKLLKDSSQSACYLTFLVDDDCTYAAAVGHDGRLTTSRLGFGRGVLANAAQELSYQVDGEPGSLTREAGIDPDHPDEVDFATSLEVLAPLAEWIAELLSNGFVQNGGILSLSLDGALYGFPMAALEVAGAPLIERSAIAIVPSANVLGACAANRPRSKYSRGFAISIPRATEFDSQMYGPETYDQDANAVRECWPTVQYARYETNPTNLLNEQLADTVVHVGSHGTFAAVDPLNRSGVVLPSRGLLPGEPDYDPVAGLLTPNITARLKAKGAHVTLRACVSGKTTQVSSREALGMIWALFQAGAPSVVAASWHVDVRSGAQMLAHFYAELARVHSVPTALRSAALTIKKRGGTWRHPYHYAAFNAFGYWSAPHAN